MLLRFVKSCKRSFRPVSWKKPRFRFRFRFVDESVINLCMQSCGSYPFTGTRLWSFLWRETTIALPGVGCDKSKYNFLLLTTVQEVQKSIEISPKLWSQNALRPFYGSQPVSLLGNSRKFSQSPKHWTRDADCSPSTSSAVTNCGLICSVRRSVNTTINQFYCFLYIILETDNGSPPLDPETNPSKGSARKLKQVADTGYKVSLQKRSEFENFAQLFVSWFLTSMFFAVGLSDIWGN